MCIRDRLCTSPLHPSIVVTVSPTFGRWLFKYSYVSASFFRQHISLPHTPEILVGFKDRFCSFAILMDTGAKSVSYTHLSIGIRASDRNIRKRILILLLRASFSFYADRRTIMPLFTASAGAAPRPCGFRCNPCRLIPAVSVVSCWHGL